MSIVRKIIIGYDSCEDLAYKACVNSLIVNSKDHLDIIPLIQKDLIQQKIYTRCIDPLASTEFAFTRFLTPYLCNYNGWAVFCDCDFIFLDDISSLFELVDERYAVMCCQHDYKPTSIYKMDNKIQHLYPRKNWSSLVLWNCKHPKNKLLTPDIINTQTGQFLHRFEWLNDSEIGSIPIEWNWLVGWYQEPRDGKPKALHFTEGGPWLDKYKDCEYSSLYNQYK